MEFEGFSGRCVGVWHGTGIEINGFCFFLFSFPAFGGGLVVVVSNRARAWTTTIGGDVSYHKSSQIQATGEGVSFFLSLFSSCS